MAGLHFDIAGNNADIIRKLKETQKAFEELGKNAENQGKNIDSAFDKISFGDTLKKQIYEGAQAVNGLTEKIIHQRKAVREITQDVNTLNEAYKRAGRDTDKGKVLLIDLNNAKESLKKEKAALFDLQTQQAQARLSVRRLKDEYSLYQKEGQNVIDANNRMALSFKKTLAAIGGVAAIKQLASQIIRVRGEFQSMQTAIETMVGKDIAGKLIPQIKELAKISPLTMSDMVGAEKMMLGFNIQAEDTIKYLKAISDISMGESGKFNSLTLAFSQMSAAGKLMGQDLNQMINAGFNPLQQISEKTGKTIATLKEEMSKGAISAEMVQQAFLDATSAGGKFYNMSENASKTINGQLSMMQDAWDNALNEIGKSSEGFIMSGIQATTSLIQNYETIGKVLVGLIATYGTYRTAVIANIALTRGWAVATRADAVAKGIQTIATKAQTVAQLALNSAMKANPYVLAATLVVGVATAMWALHDSTTAAEKAQKRFNDEQERFNKQQEDRKQKVEQLIKIIQDETETEYAKIKAYEELRQYSPALVAAYSREELATLELAKSQKILNDERDKMNYENIISNIENYKKKISELVTERDRYKGLKGDFNEGQYIKLDAQVEANEKMLKEYKKQLDEYNRLKKQAEEDAKPVKVKLLEAENNRDQIQAEIDKAKKKLEEEQEKLKNNPFYVIPFHIQIEFDNLQDKLAKAKDIVTQLLGGSAKPEIKNKSYWEKLKKDTQAQLEALSDVEAAGKKGLALKQKIAEYDKKINAFSTNTSKQENQSEKLRKEQEKYNLLLSDQQLKRVRAAEDAANEVVQAEIDAEKDGAEKVLKQRNLNHAKELQAIAREADDKRRAVIAAARAAFEANPANKGKTFDAKKFADSEDAQKEFLQINKTAQAKADAENAKFSRGDDLSGLIDKYQSFTDRRLAIEKKFTEDVKVLDEQRKKALETGDMEQVAQIDRSKIEAEKKKKEDLSSVSMEEFKADINWADLFGNLDVLSGTALDNLRDKLKNFIEAAASKLTPEDLKTLSDALTNVDLTLADKSPYDVLKTSLSDYKQATETASKAQEKLNKLQKEGKEGTIEYKAATKELSDAERKRQESLKTMTQATNNIGEKGQQVVQAGSDIVDMLTSLGVSVPESLSGALNGMGQVMSSLASIDLMKPMSILTGITGTLAGIGKTIGSLFGGKGNKAQKDAERLEATTKRLAETEKVINSFIEKRIELLKAANIQEQKNLSATTQEAINNQKKYYQQQLEGLQGNWLLAKKGKNNNLTLKDLDINSVDELEDFLSSERLLELQRNGYSIRDEEMWRKIIDGHNSVIESEKKLQDTVSQNRTGITLDEAKSALDDFVRNADTSFEDVADSFEDYMRDAMFNIVKQNYLNKEMEKFYKDFDEAMSDGELSETESKNLRQVYENAYTNSQNMYDAALKAAGISAESNQESTREAAQKGIATASQDSIDELRGTMTNVQGHTYNINENTARIATGINTLTEHTKHLTCLADIDNTMQSLLTMRKESIEHLSNIAEYTSNLVEMKEFMRSMKAGIDTLNTKGLTLKR